MTTYDNNAGMPTNYVEQPATQSEGLVDKGYAMSIPGIVKLAEIGLCLIVFICSTVWETKIQYYGGPWVQFVSMTALILTTVLLVLYLFSIVEKLRYRIQIWNMIELVYHGVVTLFFFISFCVSAAFGWRHPSIGASAFFTVCAMGAYGVDTFLSFQTFRTNQPARADAHVTSPPSTQPQQPMPGATPATVEAPRY